jgi:glycosyltransferase involved in cell wall biosynthesis
MRVCHVTSVHPWLDTRIYVKMVLGAKKEGVDVSYVAQNIPQQNEPIYGVHLLLPPRSRFFRVLFFRKKIIKKALATNPEIVHLHDPELFTYVSYFQKRRIKVVLDWHEDFPGQIQDKHWIPRKVRKPLSKLATFWCRRVCRRADANITVTPQIVKTMSYASPLLVRNFPTLTEYPVELPDYQERDTIIYLGVLSPPRGSSLMSTAVSAVAKTNPVTLVIAGILDEGVNADKMVRLAKPAEIRFLGQVDRTRVTEELGTSRIGLCVYKKNDNHNVSYPTKIFEYMMWGIPVVMSRLNSLVELFGDEVPGIFVNPDNTEEIRDAIQWLLDNPIEAEKMGLLGRKLIKDRFNWEIDLQNLINLYANLSTTSDMDT